MAKLELRYRERRHPAGCIPEADWKPALPVRRARLRACGAEAGRTAWGVETFIPWFRRWLRLFVCLSCAVFGGVSAARADLAADVARIALEMAGGVEAHERLSSLRATGVTRVGEIEAPFILYTARPDRLRIETLGESGSLVRAYDGEHAPWRKDDALKPPRRLGREEELQFMRDAVFDQPYFKPAERGVSLDYAGRVESGGVIMHRLLATRSGEELESLFIDAVSHQLVRRDVRAASVTGGRVVELHYADFREVAGVWLPGRIRAAVEGRVLHETVITEYVANPALPPDFFAPPVKDWPKR